MDFVYQITWYIYQAICDKELTLHNLQKSSNAHFYFQHCSNMCIQYNVTNHVHLYDAMHSYICACEIMEITGCVMNVSRDMNRYNTEQHQI